MAFSLPAPSEAYVRKARVREVLDGDTYRLEIDCGFECWRVVDIRLRGANAPERGTPAGEQAFVFAKAILEGAREILVQTQRTRTGNEVRSFVRYVADVWLDGRFLAEWLIAAGQAVEIVR